MEWSEQLSSGLLQAAPDAIVVTDEHGRIVMMNAQAEQLFGHPHAQLAGELIEVLVPERFRAGHARHRQDYVAGPHPRPMDNLELPALRGDGHEFPTEISLSLVETDQGRFVIAVVRDITERHQAAQAQALLASIVQSSHDAIVSMSLDRRVLTWNPGAERLYGYSEREMVGACADILVPPEGRGEEQETIKHVAEGGRVDRYRAERVRRDGSRLVVSLTVSPLQDAGGCIVGVTSMARDFGERERAESRFQALLEAAPDALVGVDGGGTVVLATRQAERTFGYPRHELLGRPIELILPGGLRGTAVEPDDPPVARRRDGSTFPVDVALSTLDTEDGRVTCVSVRDITDRLRADAEQLRLRAEAERQRLEAQLHRTRRMESLGQLAGGVAHDFNNLLGVIVNYADFVIEEATGPSPDLSTIAADAGQIVRAGQRGTELTHQLLAFARREVVRPQILDLNQAIGEVEQMLHRLLGEHITLTTRLAENLPPITADPGHVEQILVNLAVNARDAMPRGGRLVIDTGLLRVDRDAAGTRGELAPGDYVRLRVSDSGAGMPPEVADRAFEPFFTTKGSGEGTGLGLATVYGIVTQSDGSVTITSEQGIGTTVTVLLPASDGQAAELIEREPPSTGGHGETLLVVEDEAALREVTGRILSGAGYRVLSADGGARALELAARHDGEIDLLVSDVVMPGMLGKELAERLIGDRPGTRVLYMSGYAQPVLASQGTLDPGVVLLEKPFTAADLLRAVRRRLDGG